MRSNWSSVIDRRGSPEDVHSGTGTVAFRSSRLSCTAMPISAWVTDLVTDHPISGVAAVMPGA
jgi:hypothetical protein